MATYDATATVKRNRAFISSAMSVPMLTREREFELARRWRYSEDEAALHELVLAYVRLVVSMASKFNNYGLPKGDLVQEGNIGLMQAAFRFEPEREIRFSTYASWWIKSAMQDYILRNWSIVRSGTSASQKSLFFNLRWLRAKIQPMNWMLNLKGLDPLYGRIGKRIISGGRLLKINLQTDFTIPRLVFYIP